MTVQQIMNLALADSHTKSNQVSSSDLLVWFNIARKDVANKLIKDVDENYFFQIWTRDAVASQANGEYLYPEADSDSAGMLKCTRLAIKGYSTDVDYTPCQEIKLADLDHDWGYYLTNQSKAKPIYFIADESFFIAPQFAAADLPASPSGNAQIKLYGIAKFTDLAADAAASAVLVPDDFHKVIAKGMKPYILRNRNKEREAQAADTSFMIELETMVDSLTNRDHSKSIATLPDDTNLQYAE